MCAGFAGGAESCAGPHPRRFVSLDQLLAQQLALRPLTSGDCNPERLELESHSRDPFAVDTMDNEPDHTDPDGVAYRWRCG
jgi:hypothetical protein